MKIFVLIIAILVCIGSPAMSQATRPAARFNLAGGRELFKINGRDLVVHAVKEGDPDETINTFDNTVFKVDGATGTVEDLRLGMAIRILKSPPELLGKQLIGADSKGFSGTVVSVEGSNIKLRNRPQKGIAGANDFTVVTDEKTRVITVARMIDGINIPAKDSKMEDVKPGLQVFVLPETGTIKQIQITPPPTIPVNTYRMALQPIFGTDPKQNVIMVRKYGTGETFLAAISSIADIVQKKLPKGVTLEWAPTGEEGEPLSTEDQLNAFRKLCDDRGIILVVIPKPAPMIVNPDAN